MNWKIFSSFILIVVFLILLYCCSPSVNSGDSGEFITTACTLGVAHSPGYPLYSLLGKIFSYIIPFGNKAFRVNLMNVIMTLFLITSIFLWSKKRLNSPDKEFISTLIILILVFSTSYFRNTVQTEVFVVNTLAAVIILILLELAIEKHKLIYLISFIFGLSLGNHHTIVLLIPSFIYLLVSLKINLKKILFCIFFALLGFSVYVYLPIRAYKEPYFNWGNAKNWTNFYRVVTRKDYGTFQLTVDKPLKRDVLNIYRQVKRFVYKTTDDIPVVIVVFSIFAFYVLYKNNRKLFWILFLPYIISGPGFLILANLPFEPIHDGILERFYILPNTILIVTIIFSLKYFVNSSVIIFMIILSFSSLLYNLYRNFYKCNYRWYLLNYDYGINILHTLPPNSILFMDGGDDTFYTLGYLQAVEKKRSDLSLHDRGGLVFKNIYGDDFRTLSKDEKEQRRRLIESSFVKQQPVYYSTFNKNVLPGYNLRYAGVLYSVDDSFVYKQFDKQVFKEIYFYRSVYQNYYDYRSKALVPIYYFMEAVNDENSLACFKLLKYTHVQWDEVDWLRNNIVVELHNRGYYEFQRGNYELCKKIYEFILEINPADTNALLNLGVVYERIGEFDKAEVLYNKVIELDRTNVTAYYNLGALYWKKSDWDNVIKYFRYVLSLQPENRQVEEYLKRAILEKNKNLK